MRYLLIVVAGAPVALALWGFALKRPHLMLAIYAGTIPFASLIGLPLGLPPPFNTLSTTLGLAAAFIIGLQVALRPRNGGKLDSTARIWLAFLLLSTLSIFWSVNPIASEEQVLVLAGLIGLYVASSMLEIRWTQVDSIEKAIIFGGAITGAYGFFLLATGNLHQTNAGAFRFETTGGGGGDGGDPNITAAALLLPLALSIAHYFRQDMFGHRLRYLSATALIVGGIVLTGSRGGMLGVVVVVGVTYLNDPKRLPRLGAIIALLVVIVLVVPGDVTDRLTGSSSTGRTAIWEAAIGACPERCATGAGFGTFSDVFEEVWLSDPSVAISNPRIGAHNVWLGVAIEVGVGGLILLLTGLGLTVRKLSHVPADRRGPPLAGLVGVLFANTFVANLDFKYFWLALTYALLVVMAHEESLMAAAASRRAAAAQPAELASPPPSLIDVKGVGYVTAFQLQVHGIHTVGQLARTPLTRLVGIPGFGDRRARNVKRAASLLEARIPSTRMAPRIPNEPGRERWGQEAGSRSVHRRKRASLRRHGHPYAPGDRFPQESRPD